MKRYVILLLALLPFLASGQATDFPTRSLKIIVGFAAGSSIDSGTRYFAQQLSKALGQPVIVENTPGASGVLAASKVKALPEDGYTILATGMSQSLINPITIKDLPYDPNADFKPVSGTTRSALVFAVAADSKIQTLTDIVKPGLNAGSYSAGYQLYTEWFGNITKVKYNVIPYKGASAVITDLIGGRLDFALMDISAAAPLVQGGRLKLLAITANKRSPAFPLVPTVSESHPEFIAYASLALQVRKNTSREITAVLEKAMNGIIASKDAEAFATSQFLELIRDDPVTISKEQVDELRRLKAVAMSAGIHPQ